VTIKNRAVRYLIMGLELLLFIMAIAWVTKTYVAEHVARTNDVEHLQVAIKLDPDNAGSVAFNPRLIPSLRWSCSFACCSFC
jgi:hypothetical protein